MPVRLGDRFSPDFAGRPPQMPGRELAIWAGFRDRLPLAPRQWYVDVLCGSPAPPGPGGGRFPDEAWDFISSKRIDAVADLVDRWVLVEIRRGASFSAIGTLKGYLLCWRGEPPDDRRTEALLVTDFLDGDARSLAQAEGIATLEVGS